MKTLISILVVLNILISINVYAEEATCADLKQQMQELKEMIEEYHRPVVGFYYPNMYDLRITTAECNNYDCGSITATTTTGDVEGIVSPAILNIPENNATQHDVLWP